MALKLKDVLDLPALKSCSLVAGENGLGKEIFTASIADYEFAEGIDYPNDKPFSKGSLVISSLLFARDKPSLILPSVKKLDQLGVSGLIYKSIIFDRLPDEVIDYANCNSFPILSYKDGTWFEKVIFEVMTAVEKDDARFLSEINMERMIQSSISQSEVDVIRSGISLLLNRTVSAAYIKASELDLARVFRLYYMSKDLREKIMVAQYDSGLFVLITNRHGDEKAHRIILREACQTLSLPVSDENLTLSRLHTASEIHKAIQEAYLGWIAGFITTKNARVYDYLGAYSAILPLAGTPELRSFSRNYLNLLSGYEDTIRSYVGNRGDVTATAIDLSCHPNTIRYRLGKMKELVGARDETDSELFRDLSIAYAVMTMQTHSKGSNMVANG